MKTSILKKIMSGFVLIVLFTIHTNAQKTSSKEVSQEVTVSKGADINIENSSRPIQIKTWDQSKVKVTTTAYYDGEEKLTDEEWLEHLNISIKIIGNSIRIRSGYAGNATYSYNGVTVTGSGVSNGVSTASGNGSSVYVSGQNIENKSAKKMLVIYVPQSSKLDIDNKYSDVQISSDITDARIDITNGHLEMQNAEKLRLRSKYSTFIGENIKTAEIEFNNGRFSAKNIDDLDMESDYSTIDAANVKKSNIRSSNNDDYEFDEAGSITGRKEFGHFRINRLTGSIDVDCRAADIKIRNIDATVTLIKIDDNSANLILPMTNIKNYSVDFTGPYSKVYAGFEKKIVEIESEKIAGRNGERTVIGYGAGPKTSTQPPAGLVRKADTASMTARTVTGYQTKADAVKDTTKSTLSARTVTGYQVSGYPVKYTDTAKMVYGTISSGNNAPPMKMGFGVYFPPSSGNWNNDSSNPAKFTAAVGDGKATKIVIKCQNCTVDFK